MDPFENEVILATTTNRDPKKTCAVINPQYCLIHQSSWLSLTSCLTDPVPVVFFWYRFLYYLISKVKLGFTVNTIKVLAFNPFVTYY